MSALVRLFEKLTNTPHKYEESRKVEVAANELAQSARLLSSRIKPYAEAEDPLVAFMTYVFNQRSMRDNSGKSSAD